MIAHIRGLQRKVFSKGMLQIQVPACHIRCAQIAGDSEYAAPEFYRQDFVDFGNVAPAISQGIDHQAFGARPFDRVQDLLHGLVD